MLRCTLLLILSCAILSELTLVLAAPPEKSLPKDWADHWSFKPPRRSSVPEVNDRKWVRNLVVSRILLQTLEAMAPEFPAASENIVGLKVT